MDNYRSSRSLKKDLKNRHIQMIAIGGAIGVGLFYGSADAIKTGGPAIVLAYLIGGIFIFFIMRALGSWLLTNRIQDLSAPMLRVTWEILQDFFRAGHIGFRLLLLSWQSSLPWECTSSFGSLNFPNGSPHSYFY